MEYIFSAGNQALWAAGKLIQATTNTGQLLPILRDPITGKFVEVAKSLTLDNAPFAPFIAANPLLAGGNMVMNAGNGYLNNQGFQSILGQLNGLQNSLGVLQATTAVIGVGVATTAALSAVNLWQTLKLREDVKQLRLEIKDGFIDLKQALRNQGLEVIQHIDQVAQDITFNQHRLEFVKAYSRFLEATKLIQIATSIQDINARNIELSNARQTLSESLAIYNSPHILSETSTAGQLRRYECSWVIEQAIVLTYYLQGEPKALSERLSYFQNKIRQDALNVIENCQTQDELDFIFPEITRIHNHDLAALELWKNQVDWFNSLPPSDLKLLESVDLNESKLNSVSNSESSLKTIEKPPEQIFYENIREKSHSSSLEQQLKFLMRSTLRKEAEIYVSENAENFGYRTLNLANLEKSSNLTVANLYWYFKVREESEEEIEEEVSI
ncbi:hypothetical protein [Planktothrix paucivesiculata]|uniref:Uncharacterized protein n=1 Tax=Planktothrix paucivesiculata PCC 9631 TaxID=671071 RepID=A0A7Z9BVW5_9CYAN|nr:hypothetical protein [Planktothrix paucivesiculata]VXD23731.1 conserved hypothetical protein [Planktothrix paucivesiculata PCC 9631]